MATTVWPTAMDADDLTSGKLCKEITDSWMEFHWKRDRVVEQSGTTFDIGAFTGVTGTSYAIQNSLVIWVPEQMTNTRTSLIRLTLRATNVDSATCTMQAVDNASATGGTEPSSSTDGAYLESIITIPDDTWDGTERLIDVQIKRTGGTSVGINSTDMLFNLRFGDS